MSEKKGTRRRKKKETWTYNALESKKGKERKKKRNYMKHCLGVRLTGDLHFYKRVLRWKCSFCFSFYYFHSYVFISINIIIAHRIFSLISFCFSWCCKNNNINNNNDNRAPRNGVFGGKFIFFAMKFYC